jgi:hypothetical protein
LHSAFTVEYRDTRLFYEGSTRIRDYNRLVISLKEGEAKKVLQFRDLLRNRRLG